MVFSQYRFEAYLEENDHIASASKVGNSVMALLEHDASPHKTFENARRNGWYVSAQNLDGDHPFILFSPLNE